MLDKIKDTDIAYLAGLLDGEGCISMHSNNNAICVSISNTDLSLLKRVQNILYSMGIVVQITDSHNNTHGKAWKKGYVIRNYRMSNNLSILTSVLPYLTSKNERAQVAIAYINKLMPKADCIQKLKVLNKKGAL